VDAADYVVWRKMLGTSVAQAFAGADGSGNYTIGPEDHAVWMANFGQTLPPPGAGNGASAEAVLVQPVPQALQATALPHGDTANAVTDARADAAIRPEISAGTTSFTTGPKLLPANSRLKENRESSVASRQDNALMAWLSQALEHDLPNRDSADPRDSYLEPFDAVFTGIGDAPARAELPFRRGTRLVALR
jgi:hypothetical protein